MDEPELVPQEVLPTYPTPPRRDDFYLSERSEPKPSWKRHEFEDAGKDGHRPGWAAWFTDGERDTPVAWETADGTILWRDAYRIPLRHPVSMGGGPPLNELRLQALRGKFMRDMPAGREMNVGDLLQIASRMSTQPHGVFDRMHPVDVREVANRVSDFLAGGQPTGDPAGRP